MSGAELAARQCRRDGFRGELFRPGDPGYAAAREIWNAAITKQPGLIARCRTAADIRLALRAGQEHGLEISVRGGGHNIAGTALTEGGLTVDLSAMRRWVADPGAGTVHVEMGMTWGDFDAATQQAGRATPGGIVSSTGVAGLTLGGGFGWLSRRFGWACDNLLDATVVTPDGTDVRASETENPDLFWALRGGGGNFGVVRAATFRTHAVDGVFGGHLVWPVEQAAPVLRRCAEVMAAAADSACLVIGIGPAPAGVADAGARVLRVSVCESTGEEAGRALVRALSSGRPPSHDLTGVLTYLQQQSMLDAGGALGLGHYAKSSFLTGLAGPAVDTLLEAAALVPSPRSRIVLHTCGGRAAGSDAPDTAFGHRDAAYNLQIDSTWEVGMDAAAHIGWARDLYRRMAPFGSGGVYVNFLGADADPAAVRAAYGADRLDRLRRVKAGYDPGNVFHVNQNVRPADPAATGGRRG